MEGGYFTDVGVEDIHAAVCYGGILLRGLRTGMGSIGCFIGVGVGVFGVD
jgi:hypothetical protein